MKTIRFNTFNGKDGRTWLNIVFIGENNVCQWFGEYEKSPIPLHENLEIVSFVTNGRFAVVNLSSDNGFNYSVFVKNII